MDVAHVEAIEGRLDALIEKRHARRVREEERPEEAAWRTSERCPAVPLPKSPGEEKSSSSQRVSAAIRRAVGNGQDEAPRPGSAA